MGRFKIYDSKPLVSVLTDTNYAKCLLCGRTLKNIMGNIKRHYEQMHSVYVDANAHTTRKAKRKSVKSRQVNDEDYPKPKRIRHKKRDIGNTGTISSNAHNDSSSNFTSTPTILPSESTDVCRLNGTNVKRKLLSTDATIKNKIEYVGNKNPLNHTHPLDTPTIYSQESKIAINPNLDKKHQLPTLNSNSETTIANDEHGTEIQISCHSKINNIELPSLYSCGQVGFLECLVGTKTQINIPLNYFQKGDTFQMALESVKQNFNFNYSSQTIGEHMDRMAKKLRQKVIKMVENRIVYLKLDIDSSKDNNIMLVNIQFINNFEIKLVTLGVLELLNDDLVACLKKKVLSTLENYQIDISRVYSITKDNTKNVRDARKNDDTEIVCSKEEDTNTIVYAQAYDYCQHLCEQFPGHTLHFVATDIIEQLNENISQSRDSVKRLRRELSKLNVKHMLRLDNANSWFSVYDMIKSLLDVREIVKDNELMSVEVDWLFAIKFVASFKPIVETASMLQTTTSFVMGDFYREWLLCEVELEELSGSNELALYLLEVLRKRKNNFFENSAFLAALYLDQRFCFVGSIYLTDAQKEIAMNHLLQIFNKLKEVSSSFSCTEVELNDRYLKLEKHTKAGDKFQMETVMSHDVVSLSNYDTKKLREALQQLQFESRLSFNTNILDYWKLVKFKNPILAKIAEIALAVPATQGTIKRALNTATIPSQKGVKLFQNTDVIENILLIKLNQDLVDTIRL